MDACAAVIPLALPGRHLLRAQGLAVQPPVQALPVHDADLGLRHVQPTAVLGRVVELDLVQQPPGLRRRERLIQAGPVVGVQVVLHQADLLRPGVMHVHQIPDTAGVVPPRAAFAHPDMPPTPQRLTHQQLVADALALVLVVHPGRATRSGPLGRSHLAEELLAGLVEAHHRVHRVVGQQVGLDHVLHPPDILGVGRGGDAPGRDDPGLDVVFLSACRTVSVLTDSARPSTTSSSASSCKVQWQRPWGGSLQASWTNFCSTSPLILILSGRGGWGLGLRAAWIPSVTNRWRTRAMVRGPVPRAATISSSGCSPPGAVSAHRRMRAWVSLRAAALPAATRRSNSPRSSEVRLTRYLSIAELRSLRPMPLPESQET